MADPWGSEALHIHHLISLQVLVSPEPFRSQRFAIPPALARALCPCSDFIYGNCTAFLTKKSFQKSSSAATS